MTGAILEDSLARFKALMAAFSAEMVPSRLLGLWDSVSMAKPKVTARERQDVKVARLVPDPNKN